MPELEITIGGKAFQVTCQTGEEHFLRSAAQLLDNEAQPLLAQMGRLPEARMLLMAGLMLADKTAAQEDELRTLRAQVAELEARPVPEAQRIEVPVIPASVSDSLAEIAARAEALAAAIEERAPA
ncbi:MAG: cell division protein ZapA [Pseudorhodobacter sp.]|nr:cell division protein ZapA [Pseudorhodobacter sp.]